MMLSHDICIVWLILQKLNYSQVPLVSNSDFLPTCLEGGTNH